MSEPAGNLKAHPKGFFVTGTDTGVGKTYATCALMRMLAGNGVKVGGMKPVASGGIVVDGHIRNEDALSLLRHGSVPLPYDWVNPYVFETPESPHLAARSEGVLIQEAVVVDAYRKLTNEVDCLIVEGAGGWLAPLRSDFAIEDLAVLFRLPVILVVGLRLGCISHARLSHYAITHSRATFAGWIANYVDSECALMERMEHSVAELLGVAPLARLGYRDGEVGFDSDSNNHWNSSEILRQITP